MVIHIILLYKRLKNKLSCWKNLIKFTLLGIKTGKNCCIHGKLGITLHPSAVIIIGDNFYMSNGKHINPLSGNNEGHFHVEKNALLKIGSNVGLSSTRIWCSKQILIGNNVKIGGEVKIIDTDAHSLY